MSSRCVIVKQMSKEVAFLTLNRPEKRNALNIELVEDLCNALEKMTHEVRVVVLNGEGSIFCSGLDLFEATDPHLEEKSGLLLARLFTNIYSAPFVTIASVHGAALGGGAGLMSVCDLAIVTKNCKISFPEVRRGLVAAQVAVFLKRQISMRAIRELLLLGEPIDGECALNLGLVNRSVEPDDLMTETIKTAEQALKCAPGAVKETKRLLESLETSHFADDLEVALTFHHASRKSQEAKEGTSAFLEKRAPNWERNLS